MRADLLKYAHSRYFGFKIGLKAETLAGVLRAKTIAFSGNASFLSTLPQHNKLLTRFSGKSCAEIFGVNTELGEKITESAEFDQFKENAGNRNF